MNWRINLISLSMNTYVQRLPPKLLTYVLPLNLAWAPEVFVALVSMGYKPRHFCERRLPDVDEFVP